MELTRSFHLQDHAEFSYQSDGPGDNHYFVKDIGSHNGTYINGTCICVPGEPSDEIEVSSIVNFLS